MVVSRTNKMPKTRSSATTRRNAAPERQAFYITTDLLVSSRASLAPLAEGLPDAHLPMARLLVLNGISRGSVETDFRRFTARLSALGGAALRSWQTAGRRVLDIGIQAGNETRPFEGVRLSAATLSAVAALGIQIQVTVYRPGAYDMPEARP
jgi:hypothetical protein